MKALVKGLLIVLLLPLLLLIGLGLLIATPFDYAKYKRTQYYKDTGERYSWMCASSYWVKLYDAIKTHGLPVTYHRCSEVSLTGWGYFIYGDTLILNEYEPVYDEEQQSWTVEVEDVYVLLTDEAADALKECNTWLGAETCRRAVILTDTDICDGAPVAVADWLTLLPVEGGDEAAALKQWIERYYYGFFG